MPEISQDAFEILNPGAPSETFNTLRSQKNPSTSATAITTTTSSRDPQKDQKFSNGLARTDSLQPQGYKRELDHRLIVPKSETIIRTKIRDSNLPESSIRVFLDLVVTPYLSSVVYNGTDDNLKDFKCCDVECIRRGGIPPQYPTITTRIIELIHRYFFNCNFNSESGDTECTGRQRVFICNDKEDLSIGGHTSIDAEESKESASTVYRATHQRTSSASVSCPFSEECTNVSLPAVLMFPFLNQTHQYNPEMRGSTVDMFNCSHSTPILVKWYEEILRVSFSSLFTSVHTVLRNSQERRLLKPLDQLHEKFKEIAAVVSHTITTYELHVVITIEQLKTRPALVTAFTD
ncbi:hypothetical protein GQX74_010085 [Glossina fuscipes]|nr:hypothetical protein GQX74_010085 [Glossina fuscipes]